MMLPTTSNYPYTKLRTRTQGPRYTSVVPIVFLVLTCGFFAWNSPLRSMFTDPKVEVREEPKPPSITDIIPLLFQSSTIAPTEPFFAYLDHDDTHKNLTLPPNPRFTERLKKDILIVDLETRPLISARDLEKREFTWSKLNHISAGVFNHYTYALTHGYDYKFIQAGELTDRFGSWHKPSAFANHIDDYKFVVFLDADATFRFMNLPLEWLLNFWQVKPQHSLTMAMDPWDPLEPQYNSDRFNRTVSNTGFVVVQNNEFTHDILKAWHECPDEVKYKGCAEWRYSYTRDQSAFAEYVRYDYENIIKELPCAEANGYPGVRQSRCEGRFVRHYWFEKPRIKVDFVENIMNAITMPLQRLLMDNSTGAVLNQTESVIVRGPYANGSVTQSQTQINTQTQTESQSQTALY